jgi:hypothetical protein
VPVATKVKVWVGSVAPNKDNDSLWVRMDTGRWIRWNEIKPDTGCRNYDDVHDSDNGLRPVIFSINGGTHTLEFAYREIGVEIDRVVVKDDLTGPPDCSD